MREVLILGNGISRLLYEDLIDSWEGELWGCNYVYLEFGKRLDRLTGHVSVLVEALEYRKEHGCHFELWSGGLGAFPKGEEHDYCKKFTSRREHWKDSGTTIVSQALEEKIDRILVCGFDLGGRDVYTHNLHETNKQSWVERWRNLKTGYVREFDAIEFVGYDHKPFILSGENKGYYVKKYKAGLPHFDDDDYIALYALCYGDRFYRKWRKETVVKVRYIKGVRVGWETRYSERVANILQARGEIEILDVLPEEGPDELLEEKTRISSRMKVETLRKIADLRGIDGYKNMKKADLLEALIARDAE